MAPLPGWNQSNHNISWAEAIRMELLTHALAANCLENSCLKVYGDNWGVIEGWWKGRSHNHATNEVFKRIHELSATTKCTFLTCYVPSTHNPADSPSRGKYPPANLLLPPVFILAEIQEFLANFNAPTPPAQGFTETL